MKFLCDEMLQRFGRWLRTAGYDTKIVNDGRDDYEILKLARKEDRVLLTCDRALTEYRDADKVVVLLETGSLDELAKQLSQKCQINWQFQPFTRCMTCNTVLTEADEQQRETIPPDIQQNSHNREVYYCPTCNKVYWNGGHVKRMREHLEKWHQQYNGSK